MTTRSIGLTEYGGPAVLHEVTTSERHVGPGEVRIAVRAADVNPVDAIIRSGGFAGNDQEIVEPVVPGTDIPGVLDDIGPDQPAWFDLALGDAVSGFVAPSGSHGAPARRALSATAA